MHCTLMKLASVLYNYLYAAMSGPEEYRNVARNVQTAIE